MTQTTMRQIDGRLEMWAPTPEPGQWVCAEPEDPTEGQDDICGRPVDREPCPWHHPVAEVEAVSNALSGEPVWITFADNPLAKTLGDPSDARRWVARTAVETLRPVLVEQIAAVLEAAGHKDAAQVIRQSVGKS